MTAAEAVRYLRVGDEVFTYPIGEWPGGWARVVEIHPDPEAPDIAFSVIQPRGEPMGVFLSEQVILSTETMNREDI